VNPFTGPEWEVWEVNVNNTLAKRDVWTIIYAGFLYRHGKIVCYLPTPEAARQVVELIEAAEAGKPIPTLKDVAELVEALDGLGYKGEARLVAAMKEKYGL
jgi:hypothetical protein